MYCAYSVRRFGYYRVGCCTVIATKAVSKDGKPLAGAAKASFIKKCCESAAVSKDGKPLAGAAKASFIKKCESEG
jgi:hypothetical protein